MSSPPDMSPCQVCGKPSARMRYHGVVCNACRVFFFRYNTGKSRFSCPYSNNCSITHKKQRLNCSACRLKKCIEVNMHKDEIRKDVVGSLYLSRNSYAPMKRIMEMYSGIMNNSFKIVGNLKKCQNVMDWVGRLAQFDSQLLVRGGPSPSSVVANTSMSLTEMIMFPGACIDRATTACDALSNLNSSTPYKLMETVCRVFVASIESMSLIEEFHLLPPTDRLKLLQQNALMLSAYLLFYFKYTQGWGSNPSIQYLNRFQMAGGVASFWKSVISLWSSLNSVKIEEILKELQPAEEEIMLLRIRSLFRPCPDLTSEGNMLTLQARLKLASRLGEYIKEKFPSLSTLEIHKRLCRLLELETHLKDIGVDLNNTLLTLTTQGTNGFAREDYEMNGRRSRQTAGQTRRPGR